MPEMVSQAVYQTLTSIPVSESQDADIFALELDGESLARVEQHGFTHAQSVLLFARLQYQPKCAFQDTEAVINGFKGHIPGE
ncbi:hypothetical protein FQN52_008310 [Onygenales sp. PD_12]|nr:hypothetical protein FQN53_000919 [Emmonsiellopsis sp. PD_33]KAK2785760.1 hypothetical protein FQN52_008310 [Onygenales sp. PD_12]KAK2804760.1 hypothetical protein FQN51_001401 [Onygenales sp. PD_10]